MQGYVGPLEEMATTNTDFRRVLFTGVNLQLVLMALKPDESIGSEVHATHDQFFRVEAGNGQLEMADASTAVAPGDAFVVPAGVRHNLTNTGQTDLQVYTLYAPPNHADKLVQSTKAEATAHEAALAAGRGI